MSKLYKRYLSLKIENSNYFYLFENGLFYIFIAEDAKFMHSTLGLKLCNLNSCIVKCGFPRSQLNRYLDILNKNKYKFKIVDSNSYLAYSQKDFLSNNKIKVFIKDLSNICTDSVSISQSYDLLDKISKTANEIINEIEKK